MFPSTVSRDRLGAALVGGILLGLAVAAGQAGAQEADGPSVTFNLGASTDYVFRGVSQTDENPQIFGGADVTAGRWYAGVWASNVDFLDSTDAEIDVYGGFKPTAGAVTFDLGFIYYGYLNEPGGADYANWEAKFGASVPAGKATLGAVVFYSPDGFGAAEASTYYEANATMPATDKLSFSGALGHQAYDGSGDYTTWNLGVGYALTPTVGLDLRYYDTNEHDFGKLYESRVVLAAKATF